MSDNSELNLKAQAAIDAIGTLSRAQTERNFNDACTPQAVQALIAENERNASDLAQFSSMLDDAEKECDQLKADNEKLREEVALDDKLIADRDRLLNMFECPAHGQCVPYAMEQVEALRKDAERLQSATDFVQKLCDAAGKQPSVATGYLHDIMSVMGSGEQP